MLQNDNVFADTRAHTHTHGVQCYHHRQTVFSRKGKQKLPKDTALAFFVWQMKDGHSRKCGGRFKVPSPAFALLGQLHRAKAVTNSLTS